MIVIGCQLINSKLMTSDNSHLSEEDQGYNSASSLFVEIMRQKAANHETSLGDTTSLDDISTGEISGEIGLSISTNSDETVQKVAETQESMRNDRLIHRRRKRQERFATILSSMVSSFLITVMIAILTATIFTWATNPEYLSPFLRDNLRVVLATSTNQHISIVTTSLPVTPNWLRRIGIVSGHRGPINDPGAICPDGLTEAEINLIIAEYVTRELQKRGYIVDLLDEFDPRLLDYRAELLLSIHANTCQDYGEHITGFLISTSETRALSGNDQLLVECVASHYQKLTQLYRRRGLTRDMTDYHIFREINLNTPGAIIELGFMLGDRELLTQHSDTLANGIVKGILCYLEPSNPNILSTLSAATESNISLLTPISTSIP